MVKFDSLVIGKKYDRKFLAKLWGYKSYHAIAKGVFTPQKANVIILFVTRLKQAMLPQYEDFISGDLLYWEGEKKHGNDTRIINAEKNGEILPLFYREIHHTPFEYRGSIRLISWEVKENQPSKFIFELLTKFDIMSDLEEHSREYSDISSTDREAIIKARKGQGFFRKSLLDLWKTCSVTGINLPDVLTASHIKPWRISNNYERLDKYNGLLLLPQYDQLFDKGLISFEPNGRILISRVISHLPGHLLGIKNKDHLRWVSEKHTPYLDYHFNEVFIN